MMEGEGVGWGGGERESTGTRADVRGGGLFDVGRDAGTSEECRKGGAWMMMTRGRGERC